MSARIMVVDDIPANVKLLEARLSAEYFDVLTACNDAEALAMCARGECDIVLLDVMMPDMDGFEVCRRLKVTQQASVMVLQISAIALSAAHAKAALDAGADAYLMEPVDPDVLVATVRALLRLHHAERSLTLANRQLEIVNKELETFSYSVSHDLRTPLRSIDGFSQALLEDYADKLDSTGRDQLQRVRRAAQRMSVLIDDLLNLSRITRSAMRREKVDLSAVANAIAVELREAEPGRQVEFVIENSLLAVGDSRLLRED